MSVSQVMGDTQVVGIEDGGGSRGTRKSGGGKGGQNPEDEGHQQETEGPHREMSRVAGGWRHSRE